MAKRAATSPHGSRVRRTQADGSERSTQRKQRAKASAQLRPAFDQQQNSSPPDSARVSFSSVRLAFIFDVEGTLVDCAFHVTECWRQTLEEFGHKVPGLELHKYSGMDTDDMLKIILPDVVPEEKERVKLEQGRRYRELFLPTVKAFPGVRPMLKQLRRDGHRVGLATTCESDELTAYLDLTGAGSFIDVVACGDDNVRGKPHPDLIRLALGRLGARKNAAVVGDTPYDAIAAARAGIRTIGTTTGGFSPQELKDAGCYAVIDRLPDLLRVA